MQRYAGAGNSNSSGFSGGPVSSGRESSSRLEASPYASPNYPVNPRRQPQLAPYRLKCDKEPLNNKLGPPDFYPQTPNCPEETLTKEYVQSGYKETVDGIEEAREIVLSNISYFCKPDIVAKCKEALKKRLRAINESRAQKRKAGQVYGVPLSGSLLIKPGVYPEQRPCNEDSRRKWTEALAQPNKRLRLLSEHVPHGYRRKSLFDVLTRCNVPLLRATWFVKVTYLNQPQVRPTSSSISTGASDNQRSNQWTKDVVEYLQQLLDEFCSKEVPPSFKEQPSPGLISGATLVKMKTEASSVGGDTEEPVVHFKWWYMVRLVQWHLTEELLVPSVLIEWLCYQLQERDSVEALELLLPVVLGLVETITLSQTYVRMFVEILVRRLSDASVVDNPKRSSISSVIAELLRYMVLAVPDTFVSFDCFPLPSVVAPDVYGRGALLKITGGGEISSSKRPDVYRYLSCGYAVCSIQRRASDLSTLANPNLQARGAAKVVQALDKALVTGNLTMAYSSLFNDLSDALMEERWIKEVSPCLQSSLMWIGTVELSLICSVFFLCEWATCDYRDCRTSPSLNVKFSGRRDLSQIHVAVSILKNKMNEMNNLSRSKSRSRMAMNNIGKGSSLNDASLAATTVDDSSGLRNNAKIEEKNERKDMFESPGPLHDIIVCWLDQHEVSSAAGFKRVDVLIIELIRSGLFYPQAYVRQLIISGVTDRSGTLLDTERKRRHHRILKQLPGSSLFDVLEEDLVVEEQQLREMMSTYSSERRLVLSELSSGLSVDANDRGEYTSSSFFRKQSDILVASGGSNHSSVPEQVEDVKVMVSSLLCFIYPHSVESEHCETKMNFQGSSTSTLTQVDNGEVKNGCEDCMRIKGQKLDERTSPYQAFPLVQSDEEDAWWVKKGTELHESFKAEPALKSIKQTSRGRAKVVRKTQNLAQLATARIEGSQGEASTSHLCESKLSCPHHKPSTDGDNAKDAYHTRMTNLAEVGKSLKKLRLLERRSISVWLLKSVRQLVEGNETTACKASNSLSSFSSLPDDKTVSKWRLGDEELMSILYILDTCCDLVSGARFLVWLLAKIRGGMATLGQVGRSGTHMKNRDNQVCQVGEALVFSSLLRYENILLATDLLPEVLNASTNRHFVLANARHSAPAALPYTRYFLRKYRDVASVVRWEKNFRTTCDQRLLTELDNGRSIDGDLISSSGVSAGEEMDEQVRQKLNGRGSRIVPNMKEIVQRQTEELQRNLKEKKIPATPKSPSFEKEDGYQIAHDTVLGLFECIRQNGGVSPDGDPSAVFAAVSAIVVNAGQAIAKHLDFTGGNYHGVPSIGNSLNFVRHTLHVHISSLCLLKEALGDRFSRVFEVALAVEASSAVTAAFAPPKIQRNQFQPSSEAHDAYGNHTNELLSTSGKGFVGRAGKGAAAISALIVGAVVHGAVSLERMVAVLKIKDGLDILQILRGLRTGTNGASRSTGTFKMDNSVEVLVHWFRILLGNCRTVYDGLIADILGESYVLALSRLQQKLPLNVVFPPAYSIFAMVRWRQYILSREDVQAYQSIENAINDITKHQPFRDICFRNTHQLYDLLAADGGDSEFAALLEMNCSDKNLKHLFIPLRARLFLNALVDCKTPAVIQMDGSEPGEAKENELKLSEKLGQVLDTLQPAKFHWQWVELRLLLDEQALAEKIGKAESKTPTSILREIIDGLRSLCPNSESFALSESEKGFTEIILSRLVARPDAAPLYSEVVHLLGKLHDSLVVDVKWILQGLDALLGRKSTRQQLVSLAQRKGVSVKTQVWKPWGWSSLLSDVMANRTAKRKLEVTPIEEGEVVDDAEAKRPIKSTPHNVDRSIESIRSVNKYVTEKALAELMLPCIDRSNAEFRGIFAGEVIKQMGTVSEHIKAISRNGTKHAGLVPSGNEVSSNKPSGRKGIRGGSPSIGRRGTVGNDPTPPSASALQATVWLRLQFIIRLLPVILADRNMRQTLASTILCLLAARIIYEDADSPVPPANLATLRREVDSLLEPPVDVLLDRPSESLFERLLCVLHALLGNSKPSWLKTKPVSKPPVRAPRDITAFDVEAAVGLQSALDHMELPGTIRRKIQAALPILPPCRHRSIQCQPPQLSLAALSPLQSSTSSTAGPQQKNTPLSWVPTNISSRSKATLPSQDPEMEVDPWTLLEDGTSCPSASSGSNGASGITADHANLKACSWLKGAVRVRRTELTYIGSLDDDS
ncbi:LOW QUALITY PROTEIN: mediator of RNA polymerase II transcription subunit 12-like [Lolium rigidum]|uniref:LOW QUALITY PROTEIN: mediator of RNA polymerase II transcription subunit 12-like n=1 Tax=Lolium rigidum TaxID=89674 RepID=UPI001F5E0721|nr:LOW QUALITY PROTEIN: mediator of RNA polymerase II transcription subunit 12-like [Lolium rigidum]